MAAVLPRFFYDIKYVGGTEHRVDACFVEKVELVSSFPHVRTFFFSSWRSCRALCADRV